MAGGKNTSSRAGPEECDHSSDVASQDEDLVRCLCGALVARYVNGQIELKCRRCKRTMLIPISRENST